jgi:adenylate cyclase
MKSTIRLKTIITILPLLVASLAVLGTTSLFAARSGMMRLAMRNLAFKAEILKQYGDEQWGLLVSQGFSFDPDFRLAAQHSLVSRARSLLREDSEWFLALDLDGKLTMSVSRGQVPRSAPGDLVGVMREGVTGSISFGKGSEKSYGQAFYFEPFGWYIVASNRASSIFAETNRLTSAMLLAFALSVLVAAILLVRLATSITKPIVAVSQAMTEVMRSNDFSKSI